MGTPILGQLTTESTSYTTYYQLIDKKTKHPIAEYDACLYLIFSDSSRHDAEISAERYLYTYGGWTYEQAQNWKDEYELILVKVEELKERKEPVTE